MIDMVIAEDQAMLRDSLACAIDMQDDMHVVAAIADAADALSAVEKHHANLALLDVCTENDSSGIVAAASIKEAHPDVRVVVMTGMPESRSSNRPAPPELTASCTKTLAPPSSSPSSAPPWRAIPHSPAPNPTLFPAPQRSRKPKSTSCAWCAKPKRARRSRRSCTCPKAP